MVGNEWAWAGFEYARAGYEYAWVRMRVGWVWVCMGWVWVCMGTNARGLGMSMHGLGMSMHGYEWAWAAYEYAWARYEYAWVRVRVGWVWVCMDMNARGLRMSMRGLGMSMHGYECAWAGYEYAWVRMRWVWVCMGTNARGLGMSMHGLGMSMYGYECAWAGYEYAWAGYEYAWVRMRVGWVWVCMGMNALEHRPLWNKTLRNRIKDDTADADGRTWSPCSSPGEQSWHCWWRGLCDRAPPGHSWVECLWPGDPESPGCHCTPAGHPPGAVKHWNVITTLFSIGVHLIYFKGGDTYPKFLHSPLWSFGVVPQFDHGHGHWLIEYYIHPIHLSTEKTVACCDCTGWPSYW